MQTSRGDNLDCDVNKDSQSRRGRVPCRLIQPAAIVFMIVGPHSGYSLSQILFMKREEEDKLGVLYWGYGGTLCRPERVQAFASECMERFQCAPTVVMVETKSRFASRHIGVLHHYSNDGTSFRPLPRAVTMIGCSVGIVCKNLREVSVEINLNGYRVADGGCAGTLLGDYIRHQVNKACAWSAHIVGAAPRLVNVIATAALAPPYGVYFRE